MLCNIFVVCMCGTCVLYICVLCCICMMSWCEGVCDIRMIYDVVYVCVMF